MKLIYFFILSPLFSYFSFAHSSHHSHSFVPENDLYIPAFGRAAQSGLSEQEFYQAIRVVEQAIQPTLRRAGKNIRVVSDWYNGTVNAYATFDRIMLFGGMARYQGMTLDGYMAIICHEYGHTLAMTPLSYNNQFGTVQLSSEGQSDYFSGLKCLREVYRKNPQLLLSYQERASLPANYVSICNRNHRTWVNRQSCSSTLLAARNVGQTLHTLSSPYSSPYSVPQIQTPSRYVSPSTIVQGYPNSQCRLDSFVIGALCPSSQLAESFPNQWNRNYRVYCTNAQHSQPACWYRGG